MIAPIDKALGEGNCVRVTGGGKEAGAKAARLRTGTSYEAGGAGEHAHQCEAVPSLIPLVKDELVQRSITHLSGETCTGGMRAVVAPGSRACPKAWNGPAEAGLGGAGVSRGRSTDPRNPIETGRTER